jgi:hypothetical protein
MAGNRGDYQSVALHNLLRLALGRQIVACKRDMAGKILQVTEGSATAKQEFNELTSGRKIRRLF